MCVDFIWERNQDYLASHQMSWSSGCRWKSLCLQPLLLLSFTTSTPCESGLESTLLVNPDEVKLKMSSTGDQHQCSRKEGPSPSPSKLDRARQREGWHHFLLAPTVARPGMSSGYLRAAFTTIITTLSAQSAPWVVIIYPISFGVYHIILVTKHLWHHLL